MRVVILTGVRRGVASLALPALVEAGHEVACIIFSEEQTLNRGKWLSRKLKKALRLGPLGVLNGIRMRGWFSQEPADLLAIEDLETMAEHHGIPFHSTPGINTPRTRELMERAGAALGISLGNSYIGCKVFSIPAEGMINIHHELLPEYPGAQSVLWQLHDGSAQSGFTVHQVRESIDGGEILYREVVPIRFADSLHQTVVQTCVELYGRSIGGLLHVLAHHGELRVNAAPQAAHHPGYTTPSIWAFWKMLRQHRRLREAKGPVR